MTSRRTQKAAQAIREVVSMAILADLNDPRVQDVTVTYVEVAPDMRQAKVHVSVRGNETKQRLSLQGLRSAAGFLQAKLASRIETRYTPRLEFVLDLGVKKSIEMAQILGRILPPSADSDTAGNDETDDHGTDGHNTAEAIAESSADDDAADPSAANIHDTEDEVRE